MSNLAPIILSVLGGGAVTTVVSAGRWMMDERARRHAEKTADAREPLELQSLELRNAALADELLKDTIKVLRQNYAELKEQFAQYRRDTDDQRQRDLREHERQRVIDHEELDRLRQEVTDQSAVIVQLRFELQRYQSASGP
jgi:predicted RNase H-like nuclease (RuvC/YqgF family)